ncbi:NAD(P)-dependent oxidoreductase [Lichenihabitans psoromatis]|uniref:NAD(P)-dependent oxidoreductase n=1 Tax=Lichenihabitans psoromatis TaxID=2528642 RepID=UPI00103563DB|nr:NAD(P)-dependent oxidoreductase [Lichenihabitans psoromatis]
MDIGFIGLGHMGRAMATNLLRAGHQVRVWNRSPGPAQDLTTAGAVAVATAADAFAGDAVITMLADDAALEQTLAGLLDKAPKGLLHINMATISVALAKALTDTHAASGLGYIAAPVFGRTEVAVAAQLNILAAGDPTLIEKAMPLFEAMGQKVWRLGPEPYRANVVKLAGNYMIAASVQTIAEAMALGQGNGVDPHDLMEVLTGTLFGGRIHTGYGKLIADQAFEPAAFKLTLGAKDVRLTMQAAEAVNVPMPIASLLRDGFIDAIAHGDGGLDWTALSKVTFRRAGQDH